MELTQKQIDRNFTIRALGIAINTLKAEKYRQVSEQKIKDIQTEIDAMVDLRDRLELERARE